MKLMMFHAPWCAPCKMMKPVLAEVAEARGLTIEYHDVDEAGEVAQKYGVRGVPTLMAVQDDQVKSRLMGFVNKQKLNAWFEEVL